MDIKKWLLQNLKHENWFSHAVMFITTILGILIALELDKSRERADQAAKLNQYRIRLNNEIKVNKETLIFRKKSLLRNYVLLEMKDEFKLDQSGNITIEKQKLDSLFAVDGDFRLSVIVLKNLPEKRVSVSLRQYSEYGDMTLDTWQATKGSDVIQELTSQEVLLYSDIFHKIESFNKYFSSVRGQSDLFSKSKLKEVVLNFDNFDSLIENRLLQLIEALKSPIQLTEIPMPKDTSKLSLKIQDLKKQN